MGRSVLETGAEGEMKNTARLLAEIRSFCAAHADPKRADRYARFFREGYDAYGLPQELYEAQRDAWLAAHQERLGLEGFLDLGDQLIQSGKYEEASFGISFIVPFREQWKPETFQRLGSWLETGIRNWAHTDFLCGELLSRFLRDRIVPVAQMAAWRSSPSKWKRRAVPVALLGLVKKPGKVPALLTFIRPMMHDPDRVVHQGLGWFLREAWKVQPDVVEAFLLPFRDSAPRLIFQYATEKMTARDKARFRRQKPGSRRPRS
jgi:3-methyladenine DNA glycosylase AlkD